MTPTQSALTAAFWAWLAPRAERLAELVDADAPFWNDVLAQLKAIDDGLWLEIGAGMEPRELVLTASGDPELFDLVDAVCAEARPLPGWRVVALKPPMGFDFALTWEGVTIEPKATWFEPLESVDAPEILGLRVAVPGYSVEANEPHCMGVLLMLDAALGEREAATSVQLAEIVAPPSDPDAAGFLPMVDLAGYLAWRRKRSAGRVH